MADKMSWLIELQNQAGDTQARMALVEVKSSRAQHEKLKENSCFPEACQSPGGRREELSQTSPVNFSPVYNVVKVLHVPWGRGWKKY